MIRTTMPALALACLLAAGAATAAEKKDRTVIDLQAIRADNVAPNQRHQTMGALGERVHGGSFGPWRCQVKLLDRREQVAKMKAAGKSEGEQGSHFLTLSIMDPATGKGLKEGKGTVSVTGPDRKKAKSDLVPLGGAFSTDIDLPAPGEYRFAIDFASGKGKASTTFSYTLK